ncbi:MAG: hypothetical protein JXQ83_14895, partial [Candidatus Glassbacteria bacterium]|nr:hypothetical protein [Candidatus Glassbacteria bacterium]
NGSEDSDQGDDREEVQKQQDREDYYAGGAYKFAGGIVCQDKTDGESNEQKENHVAPEIMGRCV